jgi:PII-like signaling protein
VALQVTIYLNEADVWLDKPLANAIVDHLQDEGIAGATIFRALQGYTRRSNWVMDTKGKPPLVVMFIDTQKNVQKVLPTIRRMAAHRMIVTQEVTVEQGMAGHATAKA